MGSNIVVPCNHVGGSNVGTLLVIPFPARMATNGLYNLIHGLQLQQTNRNMWIGMHFSPIQSETSSLTCLYFALYDSYDLSSSSGLFLLSKAAAAFQSSCLIPVALPALGLAFRVLRNARSAVSSANVYLVRVICWEGKNKKKCLRNGRENRDSRRVTVVTTTCCFHDYGSYDNELWCGAAAAECFMYLCRRFLVLVGLGVQTQLSFVFSITWGSDFRFCKNWLIRQYASIARTLSQFYLHVSLVIPRFLLLCVIMIILL